MRQSILLFILISSFLYSHLVLAEGTKKTIISCDIQKVRFGVYWEPGTRSEVEYYKVKLVEEVSSSDLHYDGPSKLTLDRYVVDKEGKEIKVSALRRVGYSKIPGTDFRTISYSSSDDYTRSFTIVISDMGSYLSKPASGGDTRTYMLPIDCEVYGDIQVLPVPIDLSSINEDETFEFLENYFYSDSWVRNNISFSQLTEEIGEGATKEILSSLLSFVNQEGIDGTQREEFFHWVNESEACVDVVSKGGNVGVYKIIDYSGQTLGYRVHSDELRCEGQLEWIKTRYDPNTGKEVYREEIKGYVTFSEIYLDTEGRVLSLDSDRKLEIIQVRRAYD